MPASLVVNDHFFFARAYGADQLIEVDGSSPVTAEPEGYRPQIHCRLA